MLSKAQILESRYRIEKKIGNGGMGEVYKAFDLRLKIPVAVKITACQDIEFIRAFHREAQMLANLNHPSLPRIIDCFLIDDGFQVLVLEYIEGKDLKQQLIFRKNPFPVETVLNWTRQLLETLEYLHSRNILHRDIKPANIKIVNNRVFLLDFGIAYGQIGEMSAMKTENFIWESGTPDFAPLEQINGDKTAPSGDLYSLAATIYYLMTYQKPFAASLRFQKIALENADPLKDIRRLLPELPAQFASAIMSALQLSSAKRPQTAREMLEKMFPESITHPLLKKKRRFTLARLVIVFLSISAIFAATVRPEVFCGNENFHRFKNLIGCVLPREKAVGLSLDALKFLQTGKYEAALERSREAQKMDSTYIFADFLHGESYRNINFQKGPSVDHSIIQTQADKILETVLNQPLTAEELTALAWANLMKGNYDHTVDLASQALEQNPDFGAALLIRATAKGFGNKIIFAEIISDYDKAIRLEPQNPTAYAGRASAYFKKGNFDRAVSDLTDGINILPSAFFYNERGKAFFYKGNYPEAKTDFFEAVRLNQNYVEAKFNLGNVFFLEKNLTQAISFLSEALIIEPRPESFDKRGQALYALGKYAEASNDFTEAIKLDSTNYKLFVSRSAANMKLDKLQNSLADISEAIRLTPRENSAMLQKLYRWRDFYKFKQTRKVIEKNDIRATI